jgi:hypothetical protein
MFINHRALRSLGDAEFDRRARTTIDAEGGSRGRREIEQDAAAMRPAIVDAHQRLASVRAIGHFDDRAERQAAMRRRGQTFAIELRRW